METKTFNDKDFYAEKKRLTKMKFSKSQIKTLYFIRFADKMPYTFNSINQESGEVIYKFM